MTHYQWPESARAIVKEKGGNKMAGVTRLELATSGVTGQRSNQLSYTPDWEGGKLGHAAPFVNGQKKTIRATDAKEVGVENPSEETFCRPNQKVFVA